MLLVREKVMIEAFQTEYCQLDREISMDEWMAYWIKKQPRIFDLFFRQRWSDLEEKERGQRLLYLNQVPWGRRLEND